MEPYLSLGFWRAEADEVQTLLLRGLGGDAGESQGTKRSRGEGKPIRGRSIELVTTECY